MFVAFGVCYQMSYLSKNGVASGKSKRKIVAQKHGRVKNPLYELSGKLANILKKNLLYLIAQHFMTYVKSYGITNLDVDILQIRIHAPVADSAYPHENKGKNKKGLCGRWTSV